MKNLKKNKNQNNMTDMEKAEKRLNHKLKLLSALFNIIVFSAIGLCAFINQKYFECIILFASFVALRYAFPTTYHSASFWLCMFWSIAIFVIALPNVLPIRLSLLFGVLVGLLVDYILYKIQTVIDAKKKVESLETKIKDYEQPNIYKMTEAELRQYGASKSLSELQQDILVFRVQDHLRISEICEYRNYGRTTIKYHIAEIKKKLNIENI